MSERPPVFVADCPSYDPGIVRTAIARGMADLDFRPQGKVFVKPNVVYAYRPEVNGVTAYTHPTVLEETLRACAAVPAVSRIDVGEKAAVGLPTRFAYKYAGYRDLFRRLGADGLGKPIRLFSLEEDPREVRFIGGAVHAGFRVSRTMAQADTTVYLPKCKCHCVSRYTGALKLNIGICSDDERSVRHDFLLNEKIVDLLSIGRPDFTILDAVDVGAGNEAFPAPRRMGVLVMGENPLAVDLVGARLMGLDRDDVPYLAAAVRRGYAPATLDEVDLRGDHVTLDALGRVADRVKPYDDDWSRWQDLSKELERLGSPMRLHHGPYGAATDARCETGCIMALKMIFANIECGSGPGAFPKGRPLDIVIGRIAEPIACEGRDVLLLGTCTEARLIGPGKVFRVRKCFTSASDLGFTIGLIAKLPNVYLNPTFFASYLASVLRSSAAKIVSGRYAQDFAYFVTTNLQKRI